MWQKPNRHKIVWSLNQTLQLFHEFNRKFLPFCVSLLHLQFVRFEAGKSVFVATLYRKRGKMAKRFIHSGMAGITALGVMIAPILANEMGNHGVDAWRTTTPSAV